MAPENRKSERGSGLIIGMMLIFVLLVLIATSTRDLFSSAKSIRKMGVLPELFHAAESTASQAYILNFSMNFNPAAFPERIPLKKAKKTHPGGGSGKEKHHVHFKESVNAGLRDCVLGGRSCIGRTQEFVVYESKDTRAVAGLSTDRVYYSLSGEACEGPGSSVSECKFWMRATFRGECTDPSSCTRADQIAVAVDLFNGEDPTPIFSTSSAVPILVGVDAILSYDNLRIEFECGTALRDSGDRSGVADPWFVAVPYGKPEWFIPIGTIEPFPPKRGLWWGVGCARGFQRVGCSFGDRAVGTEKFDDWEANDVKDNDMFLVENGCVTDNEERLQGAIVGVVCCRLK